MNWISIKDRLPENNGRYLVNCIVGENNYINIYVYHGGVADNCGWIKNGTIRKDVTHWQPLPEPPK